MNTKQLELKIDCAKGGNGDIWMRLVSFYVAAELFPHYRIQLYIPAFFRNIARHTFGERLDFLEEASACKLVYTSMGLRYMLGGFAKGKRFVAPYHRVVHLEKQHPTLKDTLNAQLFNLLNAFGVVQVPKEEYIPLYQGFLDIAGIRAFKDLNYADFLTQLELDALLISDRLKQENLPTSAKLKIPEDLREQVLVFPNGTSRQFVPAWWVKQHLPDAYYAFFVKDAYAETFRVAGLKVLYFYEEPGDIIALAKQANWAISTDSFPSHLLQYALAECTIAITEVLKSRIISPVHRGKVVDAVAPCHPCPHLERKQFPRCAAGHKACLNWSSIAYSEQLVDSVMQVEIHQE